MKQAGAIPARRGRSVCKGNGLLRRMKQYRYLYLMLIPVAAFYIIFKYIPIYGLQLAFKKFSVAAGISGSPWIGMTNFVDLMREPDFWSALQNTVSISLLKLALGFPFAVLLAVLISEVAFTRYRKCLQVLYTFPHFLSWVILSSICFNLLSSTGAVNNILAWMGMERFNFLTNPGSFRMLLVATETWKEAGWNTIIYMATITGIDATLYEAAYMDGASRLQKIRHVVWPGLKPIVATMLILQIGNTMSAGFMQIFNMYNPAVYSVGDILDTYIYRITFQTIPNFGMSTAVGLFTGAVNFVLLFIANKVAGLLGEKGVV